MALADLLGRRVVVRSIADSSGPSPTFADVVGVLVAADTEQVTVRRADGTIRVVELPDVHRLKPVRPSPADMLALEEVAALGWPALEAEWLGRWLLRASRGWTGRGNSVLPLGDPGLPLDAALASVTAWYSERRLRARFGMPLPVRSALDEALGDRGWTAYNSTAVLTADIGVTLARLGEEQSLPPVVLEPAPSAGWLSAYHYRGGAELPDFAVRLMTSAERPVFASVVDGGDVVAIARGVVDRGWLGVTAVEVAGTHRRRGLATHVMRALLGWAAGHGAASVYLQVAEDNAPALAFYERLRFARHHRYQYRLAPEEAAS